MEYWYDAYYQYYQEEEKPVIKPPPPNPKEWKTKYTKKEWKELKKITKKK
mgnify:CR=1 FL=1